MAKFLLSKIKKIEADPNTLMSLDQADETLCYKRLNKLKNLAESPRYQQSRVISEGAAQNYSDAQLSKKVGIPFLFANLAKSFPPTPVLSKATDFYVYDVDGNEYIDFSNSLSNNYFGYLNQHQELKQAIESVDTGAIMANYSSQTHELTEKLKSFSKKDLVSLHMSGTEAVMQACSLARYNTGKEKIVTFTGSYHGWWDGVQAGVGSTRKNTDSIMLEQETPRTLRVLNSRNDIAAVLVNPLHFLFPNITPPLDSATFGKRITPPITETRFKEYQSWLLELQAMCEKKNIALIFDEVYMGHRLGWGGAQEYFKVKADIAVYGKSFGCGLPIGIVCAEEKFGKRIHDQFPFKFLMARGTFQGNPYVVAAALKAIHYLETQTSVEKFQAQQSLYKEIAQKWNQAFKENSIPLSVSHFESIFTFNFLENSLYNWLLAYFLRDAGIYVSTIPGLARVALPLNFNHEIADQSLERIVQAAQQMKVSGFWGLNNVVQKRTIVRLCVKSFLRPSV
ncbi:MAG: aminotransferase class III-fold pyridoxal phosphate-dependent enzyme [Bacteriovoracaceae bacterium]